MIDVHCHLEQPDYEKDRDAVVENCRKQLRAVITSCAHPKDLDLTLRIVAKYDGFVFATLGIHPEHIKEITAKEVDAFLERIKENKERIVGIGETGLDYYWVKEENWRDKQKELFIGMIALAKGLNLPLVIHSRDAYEDTVKTLEAQNAKSVVLHMFGANQLTERVVDNSWFISMNTIVLKSKKHRKVVRDTPLQQLLLETDAPWLAPEGLASRRNDPTAVRFVVDKIAEIKRVDPQQVDRMTTENAIKVFHLGLPSENL